MLIANKVMDDRKVIIYLFLLLVVFLLTFFLAKDTNFIVDESAHYLQIEIFVSYIKGGEFFLSPVLPMIPGYHFVMAALAYMVGILSPSFIRFLSTIFSYISVIIFLLLLSSTKNYVDSPIIKGLQYAFFPTLFSFWFLIYTDSFSILLVLISLYLFFNKRYYLAGIIGIASILIRQTNIIWLLFIITFAYYEKNHFKFNLEMLIDWFKNFWVFILGFMAIVIVFLINGRLVIGNAATNIFPLSLYFGNIYFYLFSFFFLFLPLNIANRSKIDDLLRNNKYVILGTLVFFIFYLLTVDNLAPHNLKGTERFFINYFLRNEILITFTSSILLKALFFIPIAYSLFSIIVTRMYKPGYYLLHLFTIFYLIPIWPVLPRYHVFPFILFILFKEENSKLVEYSTIVIYFILSILLFYGTTKGWFYPG